MWTSLRPAYHEWTDCGTANALGSTWTRTKFQAAIDPAQSRRLPMQRRDINAADAPPPAGQYTQAVEVTGASRMLYLSGQVGIAADGSIPADAEAQSALAWRNLQAQ